MCDLVIDWSACAAWVQAIGAIIALGIAIELPRRDQRQQREQLREVFRKLAGEAIDRIDILITRSRQERAVYDIFTLRLGEITGLLARLPLDKLDAADLGVVLEFTALCRRLTDFWNEEMKERVEMGIPGDTSVLENGQAELQRLRASLGLAG